MSHGLKKMKGGRISVENTSVNSPILWMPSESTTLRSWFDPSHLSSLSLIGNDVVGINPRSGHSNLSLEQSVSTKQPNDQGLINGINCLRVEELSKNLSNSAYVIPDNKQFCIIMIVNAVVGLGGFRSSFISMNGSNDWDLIARSASNLTGRLQTSNISVDGPASFNTVPSIGVGLSIISIVFGDGTMQVNVDGTQRLSGAYLNNIQASELQWMADRSGTRSIAGDYGDLIIDDDITQEDKHVGYLAHRFAKANDLPEAHPYKHEAPLVMI